MMGKFDTRVDSRQYEYARQDNYVLDKQANLRSECIKPLEPWTAREDKSNQRNYWC